MFNHCRGFAVAAFLLSLTPVGASAQAPALDIKMGLWELTTTTNMAGQMPAIDTSKMTPQQKAQMEGVMKGLMTPQTHVTQSCVTKEKMNQSNFLSDDKSDQSCKRTISSNTKTNLDMALVCTGEHASTGQMHIEAATPTALKANMNMVSADKGRGMNMTILMTGKWLAADCGKVE